MSAKATIMKFGGTSVEDGLAFERVARIVGSYKRASPVVVLSAMSCVTDALLSSLRTAAEGEPKAALRSIEEQLERHLQVARNLGTTPRANITSLIEDARQEIAGIINEVAVSRVASAFLQDITASYGERLSASLFAVILDEHGIPATYVDARRCIVTNEEHGKAQPLLKETWRRTRAELLPLLKARRVPVMGGFIAATRLGVTTTLGRGSSDFTATLVGAILGARETQIWTDVNGVLTADPRLIRTARTIPQLSYDEAAELARYGVKVLHTKMIQPAADKEMPVRICNSRAPEAVGTLICGRSGTIPGDVKAIVHRTGLTTIEVTSASGFFENGFMHAIQEISDRHQTTLDIVAASEIGVSLACEETSALPFIVQDLQRVGSVLLKKGRAIISCVGEGLRREPDSVIKHFNTCADIDSTIACYSTSDHNCISVVNEDCVDAVIKRLHQAIFEHGAVEEARLSS